MFGIKNPALDETVDNLLRKDEVQAAGSSESLSNDGPSLIPAAAFTDGFSVTKTSLAIEHAFDIWVLQPGWMPELFVMCHADVLSLAHALLSATSGDSESGRPSSYALDGTLIEIDFEEGVVNLGTSDGYLCEFSKGEALRFAMRLIDAVREDIG